MPSDLHTISSALRNIVQHQARGLSIVDAPMLESVSTLVDKASELLAMLSQHDELTVKLYAAGHALSALADNSWLDSDPCDNEHLSAAKDQALKALQTMQDEGNAEIAGVREEPHFASPATQMATLDLILSESSAAAKDAPAFEVNAVVGVKLSFVVTVGLNQGQSLVGDAMKKAVVEQIVSHLDAAGGLQADDVDDVNLIELRDANTDKTLLAL